MNNQMVLITGGSGFIGTNLQELLLEHNFRFINMDINPPSNKNQVPYWVKGDVMDPLSISSIFKKYQPTIVIHFAARTDTASSNLKDYEVNYIGTELLINEIKKHDNIERCVFTSTQYVYKDNTLPFPPTDFTYKPHTIYGLSKMKSEILVREAGLRCCWTIIRPTNIWGPWHMRYPIQLWKYMDKGIYFHPTKKTVVRSYGYVKNLNHQLLGIITVPKDRVYQKTFYLGDLPIDSNIWLKAWVKQLTNRELKYIPSFMMKMAAKVGDILIKFGMKFPMYSVRYRNMLEDYIAPTNITIQEFGSYNDNLSENIKETIKWLTNEGKEFFPYWAKK